MKHRTSFIALLAAQLLMFYVFPLLMRLTDPMGMVFLILAGTPLLGIIAGCTLGRRQKLLWPLIVALVFLPTVPIYYNESALIHSVWYFVVSTLGLGAGMLFRLVFRRFFQR